MLLLQLLGFAPAAAQQLLEVAPAAAVAAAAAAAALKDLDLQQVAPAAALLNFVPHPCGAAAVAPAADSKPLIRFMNHMLLLLLCCCWCQPR